MKDKKLIAIAKDLVETVRKHRTHDWDKKVQAQASMRLYIKKVLRKHGYPPNKEPKIVENILKQAKLQAG